MNWDEFDEETRRLARMITSTPDIVVGITRGGVIPATLISKVLGVKDMFVLKLERGPQPRISAYALSNITGKKVLLVEDMIETGRGLIAGKKYLEDKGAFVETACLYTMSISEFVPDYSLRKIDRIAEFPWNK